MVLVSTLWWTLKYSTHGSSVVKNGTCYRSLGQMLLQNSDTQLMVTCVILLSPFYRYNSSCWQEWYQVFTERSWQRKGCTITWLVSSRLSNYSHGCCYMGIPFVDSDGRISRNKYVNLSNTVVMSLLDSHGLERSKTEVKNLLQLQPQPQ